jgi:hypothetical protein
MKLSQLGLELLHFNLIHFDLILSLRFALIDLDTVRFVNLSDFTLERFDLHFVLLGDRLDLHLESLDLALIFSFDMAGVLALSLD